MTSPRTVKEGLTNQPAKALQSSTGLIGGGFSPQNSGPWKNERALTNVALLCIILETSAIKSLQVPHASLALKLAEKSIKIVIIIDLFHIETYFLIVWVDCYENEK